MRLRSIVFFLYCSGAHRDLHSFPTRRSSDLNRLYAVPLPAMITALQDTIDSQPATRAGGGGMGNLSQSSIVFFVDRKSTRLNSSHITISYAVFCLKKKINYIRQHSL